MATLDLVQVEATLAKMLAAGDDEDTCADFLLKSGCKFKMAKSVLAKVRKVSKHTFERRGKTGWKSDTVEAFKANKNLSKKDFKKLLIDCGIKNPEMYVRDWHTFLVNMANSQN